MLNSRLLKASRSLFPSDSSAAIPCRMSLTVCRFSSSKVSSLMFAEWISNLIGEGGVTTRFAGWVGLASGRLGLLFSAVTPVCRGIDKGSSRAGGP